MSDVKKGTKIEAEEAKTLDPAKRGPAEAATPDVEGQELIIQIVECPWCGHLRRLIVDSNYYYWYECSSCGLPFRA